MVGALPNGAGGHRTEARNCKVIHPEGDPRQAVRRGSRRAGIYPPVSENTVPEAYRKAFLRYDAEMLLVLKLDREKADGTGADVYGRNAQRSVLYCFSSWR